MYYVSPAVGNINKLIEKIDKSIHHLIVIDEILVKFDCLDFSELLINFLTIHLYMAVNPNGYSMTKPFVVIPPIGDNVFARRLRSKHRNCYLIAVLLSHVNYFLNQKNDHYKCLAASEDRTLDASTLALGHLPIWIQTTLPNTPEENVLQYIKENYLKNETDVTVLISIRKILTEDFKKWCKDSGWTITNFLDMTGSERKNVVAIVEDVTANLEVLSRAKERLFIITAYVSLILKSNWP